MDIEKILYIDEIEKFMRLSYLLKKEWFNSFITFQNLKKNKTNFLFPQEKGNVWIPYISVKNMDSLSWRIALGINHVFVSFMISFTSKFTGSS